MPAHTFPAMSATACTETVGISPLIETELARHARLYRVMTEQTATMHRMFAAALGGAVVRPQPTTVPVGTANLDAANFDAANFDATNFDAANDAANLDATNLGAAS